MALEHTWQLNTSPQCSYCQPVKGLHCLVGCFWFSPRLIVNNERGRDWPLRHLYQYTDFKFAPAEISGHLIVDTNVVLPMFRLLDEQTPIVSAKKVLTQNKVLHYLINLTDSLDRIFFSQNTTRLFFTTLLLIASYCKVLLNICPLTAHLCPFFSCCAVWAQGKLLSSLKFHSVKDEFR